MNALRYHADEGLLLEDIPAPAPGPGEVLLEVRAVGVCRTDIEIVEGSHPFYVNGGPEQPLVPGHEWSGVVRELGAGVFGPPVGTLVTGETGIGCGACDLCRIGQHNACPHRVETGIFGRDGAMRELHVHPAALTYPCTRLSPEEAALVEPASVGVYAAQRAGVRPGDRVIVLGGGSIGQMALQAARAFGATEVMLATRSPEKLALAAQLGADATFDAGAQDFVAAVMEHTSGDGVHVVIEASGSNQSLRDAVSLARPLARIVILGVFEQPWVQEIGPLVANEYTILPTVGSPGVWPLTISLMERGRIQAGPLISGRFPIADYRWAFETVARGGPTTIKCLLLPRPA
ncbi:MAG: zinc-binding dehydrogenase [Armatimonadetes bacterium]|nr:zinc-binding dehydrogenase [Armatimonadota bacterium]